MPESLILTVRSRIDGPWTVVDVNGEVDLYSAPELRAQIKELIADGYHRIIIDLHQVSFMDSTGLGVLVGALKRVNGLGGDLVLIRPQAPVARILSVTGLDRMLRCYETLDEILGESS